MRLLLSKDSQQLKRLKNCNPQTRSNCLKSMSYRTLSNSSKSKDQNLKEK